MTDNGIIHKVIDMPGTKNIDIPEQIMHSIMTIALDQENYPLLIHCNRGKVSVLIPRIYHTSDFCPAPYWVRRSSNPPYSWLDY
jgi:hypothetical protein